MMAHRTKNNIKLIATFIRPDRSQFKCQIVVSNTLNIKGALRKISNQNYQADFFLTPLDGIVIKQISTKRPIYLNTVIKDILLQQDSQMTNYKNIQSIQIQISKQSLIQFRPSQSLNPIYNDCFNNQDVQFNIQSLNSINQVLQKISHQEKITSQDITANLKLPRSTAKHLLNIIQNRKQNKQPYSPIKQYQSQVQKWKNFYQQKKYQYQNTLQRLNDAKEEINHYKTQRQRFQIQLQRNLRQREDFFSDKNNQIKNMTDYIKKMQIQRQQYESLLQKKQSQIKSLRQQQSKLLRQTNQSKSKKIQLTSPFMKSLIYFNGILSKNNKQILQQFQFLKQQIETKQNKVISSVQKLYQYDPYIKVNFHNYIDDKSNILILIKLKNQKLIGAYSQGGIQFQGSQKSSFIFSLSDFRAFHILQRKKSQGTPYDPYYIIFGKQELCLKNGSSILRCELGNKNNYCYQAGDSYNYKNLLGSNQKQAQIQSYQILQIIFS